MTLTRQEIIDELKAYFHLMGKDFEDKVYDRFARSIEGKDRYYRQKLIRKHQRDQYAWSHDMTGQFTLENFFSIVEECYQFLEKQGYNDDQIDRGMRFLPLTYYRAMEKYIPVYEALGVKDYILIDCPCRVMISAEELHARRMYAKEHHIALVPSMLTNGCYREFQSRCSTELSKDELKARYPLTKEAYYCFSWIKSKSDEELQTLFHMSREEILKCYPTTREEIKTIQLIGYYDDEQLMAWYGLDKESLLDKYPLNFKTLEAIHTIHRLSDEEVQATFGKSKEELLQEPTISLEGTDIDPMPIRPTVYTKKSAH